jgi:hypothetical protein
VSTPTLTPPFPATQQRDLAVARMNRGHALMMPGDAAGLTAALEAYNEAIVRLRPLIANAGPEAASWTNSLGAALTNRGHLLHRLHGVAQATLALEAYDEAAVLLRSLSPRASPWPRRNLAGALLNRANLLLDLVRHTDGAAAAREALALSATQERFDVVDADLALKARRTLCDALGRLIVKPGADQASIAAEASDLVDDSLALIRDWTGRGENAFGPLAIRLFRYGTQLYRLHQPHFLAEFIRENLLQTDAEWRAIALESIDAALAGRPDEFLTIGDPASERRVETGRELAALRSSLAA